MIKPKLSYREVLAQMRETERLRERAERARQIGPSDTKKSRLRLLPEAIIVVLGIVILYLFLNTVYHHVTDQSTPVPESARSTSSPVSQPSPRATEPASGSGHAPLYTFTAAKTLFSLSNPTSNSVCYQIGDHLSAFSTLPPGTARSAERMIEHLATIADPNLNLKILFTNANGQTYIAVWQIVP